MKRPTEALKLCIIADDFTGAADAGAPFADRGRITDVLLPREGAWSVEDSAEVASIGGSRRRAEVLVLDTESRFVSSGDAAAAVKEAVQYAQRSGFSRFFKKVDSTLRGNVGAELAAAMDALEASTAVFAPAFPEQGRTTEGGTCYVHGVPLGKTEVARDPKNPTSLSTISDILRSTVTGGLETVVVNPSDYWRIPEIVRTGFSVHSKAAGKQRKVVIANAWETIHLARFANTIREIPDNLIVAGSAGLTRHLAPQGKENGQRRNHGTDYREWTSGVVIVAGSLSTLSTDQIDYIEATIPNAVRLSLDTEDKDQESAKGCLASGGIVLFSTSPRRFIPDASELLAERVSSLVINIQRRESPPSCVNLLVVGGDTAVTLLRKLRVRRLELTDEPLPGIGSGYADTPHGRLHLVTKAGAFGSRDTLAALLSAFPGRP